MRIALDTAVVLAAGLAMDTAVGLAMGTAVGLAIKARKVAGNRNGLFLNRVS